MPPDEAPARRGAGGPRRHLLRRCALGLWFCALAVLGLVRTWLASAEPVDGGTITRLWLWGSLALLLIGVLVLARAVARPR